MCVKSRYIGDGHPTFNRNPYNGYINPYHPLLCGNNGSLDPGTSKTGKHVHHFQGWAFCIVMSIIGRLDDHACY